MGINSNILIRRNFFFLFLTLINNHIGVESFFFVLGGGGEAEPYLSHYLLVMQKNANLIDIYVMSKAVSNRDICFTKAVMLRTKALFTTFNVAWLNLCPLPPSKYDSE